MNSAADLLTRRQALARVAGLVGGTLGASTVAGVLSGCSARAPVQTGGAWVPRALSREQAATVLAMGEIILPETDTPGARTARVDQFIDVMLADYYGEPERTRFIAGLTRADERARRAFGRRFLELPAAQQTELVHALNRAAFARRPAGPGVPPEQAGRPADPVLQENDVQTGNEPALPTIGGAWEAGDRGPDAWFRTLKELVLVGFYTSEAGATEELAVNPMGVWRADVPYAEIGQAWA